MNKCIKAIFLLLILLGFGPTQIHSRPFIPKYLSDKEAFNEKLIKRLSLLNFESLLKSTIPQQLLDIAHKIHETSEESVTADFLKIWPLNGENEFTQFLKANQLGSHIKKYRNRFVKPIWNIHQLSEIIKSEPVLGRKSNRLKSQLKELQSIWSDILTITTELELEKKIESTRNAYKLLTTLYASRVVAFIDTLPPLSKIEKNILNLKREDFFNNERIDFIFAYPVLVEMNISDPKTAETVLNPIYKDIKDIWFLRNMVARFWPEQIPLSESQLSRLKAAFKAHDAHTYIKAVVKHMKYQTLLSAKQALGQISSSVMIIPETINDVTQKIGPFKDASDEIVDAAKPVLENLNKLQESVQTFIEGLDGKETDVESSTKKTQKTVFPQPQQAVNGTFLMGAPVASPTPIIEKSRSQPSQQAIMPSAAPQAPAAKLMAPVSTAPIPPETPIKTIPFGSTPPAPATTPV